MADMMMFPSTVDEFMEQYKITDTKEIYTNGAELVPIFRMKQWFDHKPEQKTGRWLPHWCEDGNKDGDICSCCHEWFVMPFGKFPYCPQCGADMRGEQE